MNPEIAKAIAALRVEEMQAIAAERRARRARRALAGRALAALPLRGSAVGGGWNPRRRRLVGRWLPAGRSRPERPALATGMPGRQGAP